MNEYILYCQISGDEFRPSKFPERFDDFVVASMCDPGSKDLIDKKDKTKYEFGSVSLTHKDAISDNFDLVFNRFLTNLLKLRKHSELQSLEFEIQLDIGYETQCNHELYPQQIQLLSKLGAWFSISCYRKPRNE